MHYTTLIFTLQFICIFEITKLLINNYTEVHVYAMSSINNVQVIQDDDDESGRWITQKHLHFQEIQFGLCICSI